MNSHPLTSRKETLSNQLKIVIVFTAVYVVLFEFILPLNYVLPKPSLLLESFRSLWVEYDLLNSIAFSSLIVYSSLIVGYALIHFGSGLLVRIFVEYPGIFYGIRIFRFFPAFFYAVLFAFWFPNSLAAEFFYSLVAVAFLLIARLWRFIPEIPEQYVLAARSLGTGKQKIYSGVVWKSAQPRVFGSLKRIHYYLWILVLIFGFVGASETLGGLYGLIFAYKDFSGLFALAIVIAVLIWLGDFLIRYFNEKYIKWEI